MNKVPCIPFLFALMQSYFLAAQCVESPPAFRPGERLTYEVAYNWGVLWVDAGEAEFRAEKYGNDSTAVYSFESTGKSYRVYDLVFKVRDRFRSTVRAEGFEPVWFGRETSEGGYDVNNSYQYDWARRKVISSTENSNSPLKVDTMDIEPCTFDVLSAIYYARSFDFESRRPGDRIPIRFIIDGEFYDLYIRYLGKELQGNRSGKEYMCYKFSALLVEGTIFKGGEDLVAWVTADENKVPVMVEAKILIGSVKAYLTGWENTLTELQPVK